MKHVSYVLLYMTLATI